MCVLAVCIRALKVWLMILRIDTGQEYKSPGGEAVWGRRSWVKLQGNHMGSIKRIWYLSPMRAAKVQASLRIRAVSPEPPLLAHTSSESRGTFRQKARSLVPMNSWACAVKICHDGMLEDTNLLDAPHIEIKIGLRSTLLTSVTGSTNSCWGLEQRERVEGKKSRAGERRTAEQNMHQYVLVAKAHNYQSTSVLKRMHKSALFMWKCPFS